MGKLKRGAIFNKKGWILGLIVLGMVLTLIAGGMWVYQEGENPRQAVGLRAAPHFKLPDSQGHLHTLDEFRGNVILLHFWASWCPPCLSEISEWSELSRTFQGRSIRLVGVSLDQSWKDALNVLPAQKETSSLISLLDTANQVSDEYGSYQFPETYLINAQLKIVKKWVGPQNWADPKIRNEIEQQF